MGFSIFERIKNAPVLEEGILRDALNSINQKMRNTELDYQKKNRESEILLATETDFAVIQPVIVTE